MKAVIIYASRTGKTKDMAEAIKEAIEEVGHEVDIYPAAISEVQFLRDYDMVLLGSSTYGQGELLSDFQPFYEALEDVDLKGKKAAAFGTGSHRYPDFCNAVNILEARLIDCGATVSDDGYKIDGPVMFDIDYLQDWAKKLVR